MQQLDPVTAEILRNMLSSVVATMAARLAGNAASVEIVEGKEFSTALLDEKGAVAFIDNSLHLASVELTAKNVLDQFGFDMQPGDVFLTNDPYGGGSHQLDFTIVSPVAIEMDTVAILAVRAKMPDIGGQNVGGFVPNAKELWAEGARFTPLRIYREDKVVRDALATVLINSRFEEVFRSNLDAMMLALRVGRRMASGLISEYGLKTVQSAIKYSMDYSERYLRGRIRGWPNGTHTGCYYIDHDGAGRRQLKVNATFEVRDDSVEIDFAGSDPQSQSFVNATYGDLCSYALLPFLQLLEESVPRNSGLLRPITFSAPKGSLVNPVYPGAVGFSAFYPGATIATAVTRALEGFLGDEVINPSAYSLLVRSVGNTATDILDHSRLGIGSCSASRETDGWGAPPLYSRRLMPSVELYERTFDGRIESIEFAVDSGGPGKRRGGLGTQTTMYFHGPRKLMAIVEGRVFPVPGSAGGRGGSPNRAWLVDEESEKSIEEYVVGYEIQGKRLVFALGGGGGWGDPLERRPGRVLEDYLDEIVSRRAAEEEYGVIFTSDGRAVDEDKTDAKRRLLQRSISETSEN